MFFAVFVIITRCRNAAIAQLVRAPACHAGGWRFEPAWPRIPNSALYAPFLIEKQWISNSFSRNGSIIGREMSKEGIQRGISDRRLHAGPLLDRRSLLLTFGATALSSCGNVSQVSLPTSLENGCQVVWSRERRREGDPMRAYENDFLAERELEDTVQNREFARVRIGELRQIFGKTNILRGKVLLGLGADKLCGSEERFFINSRAVRLLERKASVTRYTGVPDEGEPTLSDVESAVEAYLTAIKETDEPISPAASMHGSISTITFGYGSLIARLAESYAIRSADTRLQRHSETQPEAFTFQTCGSGGYGKAFLTEFQRIRRENGLDIKRASVTTVASVTGDDFGFTDDSILEFVSNSPQLEALYEHESSIGNLMQRSNPEVHVIDPETGDITKVV